MATVEVFGRYTVPGNDSPTAIHVTATRVTIMRNDLTSAEIFLGDVKTEAADGIVESTGESIVYKKNSPLVTKPATCELIAVESGLEVGFTIKAIAGGAVIEEVAPRPLDAGGVVQIAP